MGAAGSAGGPAAAGGVPLVGAPPSPRPEVNNFGDTRSGGLAGPLGALVVACLAVAVVLLIRNMNARLRRLPRDFRDAGPAADGRPGPAGTVDA